MFDIIKNEKKILIFLLGLFLVNLYFFFLKQGSLTIDVGREFYIPWQMLKGAVLYKDIFNIYGPLAYQINSAAYFLFGQKIFTLYAFSVLNSIICLVFIYLISREFLDKLISLFITIFVLYACAFSLGLFNYNLPYSYSMVYAFSSFLVSLWFLIRYSKDEKPLYAYISSFFAGISIACKYDYIFFPFVIGYVILFLKPLKKTDIIKCFFSFASIPILSYGALFIQGLKMEDIKYSLHLTKTMASTHSIKHLYTYYSGTYFNLKIFYAVMKNFSYLAGVFFILFSFDTVREKAKTKTLENFYSVIFVLLTLFSVLFFQLYKGFGFFPVFLSLIVLIFFKQIVKEPEELILYSSAIVGSFKTFFALNISMYGIFTLPLIIVSLAVFLLVTLKKKSVPDSVIAASRTSVLFLLFAFILYYALIDFSGLKNKQHLLKTEKGVIYAEKETVSTYNKLIEFINKNVRKNEKVVVLPETPFVNFMTSRDSDNYFNSLIPLYIETFGEDKIIDDFKQTKPEYIVINNRDTSDYGKRYMCSDYAQKFCSFVKENYSSAKIIEGQYKAIIYKRKDLK